MRRVSTVCTAALVAALLSPLTSAAADDVGVGLTPLPFPAAISPTSGPTAGGTSFTIYGSQFQGGATVSFNGVSATSLASTGTSITGLTPPGVAGGANVTVTNPGPPATTVSMNPGSFTYTSGPVPTPAITSMTPTSGPASGGTTVTIAGTNFTSGATVSFGVTPAVVTSATSTTITCTSPVGSVGAVPVTVSVPGATPVTAPTAFSYQAAPPPVVQSVSPNAGPQNGGTAITITGTGFDAGATVTVNNLAATSISVVSSTSITAVTPVSSVVGPVPVSVINGDGQAETLYSGFTYTSTTPTPAPVSITPASAPTGGGTAFSIIGTGFASNASVQFDSAPATAISVAADGATITGRTPAGAAGPATVTVTNPGAPSASGTLPAGSFTYVTPAQVAITSISPTSGPLAGGTTVRVTGSGFASGATASVGGQAATNVTVSSSNSLTLTTPAGSSGVAPLTVSVPGSGSATLPNAFTYQDTPVISSITPTSGPLGGGTAVSISGSAFDVGADVIIDGQPATNVLVISPSRITAVTPAAPSTRAGSADVVVANPNGQFDVAPNAFTYTAPVSVTTVAPSSGSTRGGTQVTITGTGFRPGTTVTIGAASARAVDVVSSSTVTAITPAAPQGAATVTVSVPGAGSASLPNAFTYVGAVSITSVFPTSGPASGGTSITIGGTGFTALPFVLVGGLPATSVSVLSPTQLTAFTPVGSPGTVAISVSVGASPEAILPNAFTYVASSNPPSPQPSPGGSTPSPTPSPSPTPTPAPTVTPMPAPITTMAQKPVRRIHLAKRLRTHGLTQVVKVPITTNAGRNAVVTITGRPAKGKATRSRHAQQFESIRTGGYASVWLSGKQAYVVTVHINAPASPGFASYSYSHTYRVPKYVPPKSR